MSDKVAQGLLIPKAYSIYRDGADDLALNATEQSYYFAGSNIIGFGKPASSMADISGRYVTETSIVIEDSGDVGFDAPNMRIAQYELLNGTSSKDYSNPHLLQDNRKSSTTFGGYFFAADLDDSSSRLIEIGAVLTYGIPCNTAGDSSAVPDVIDPEDGYTNQRFPALSIAMDGSDLLYLFYIGQDYQQNQTLNIMVYRYGSWRKIKSIQLWTGTKVIRRLRAGNTGAYVPRWLLLIHVEESQQEYLYQYAGYSASTLQYVDTVIESSYPEISFNQSELLAFSVRVYQGGAPNYTVHTELMLRRIVDPFVSMNDITATQISTSGWGEWRADTKTYSTTNSGIAALRTHDNILLVYGANRVCRSKDGGVSWEELDRWYQMPQWASGYDYNIRPQNMSAVEFGSGQIVIAGVWKTTDYKSMIVSILGGWSSTTMPSYNGEIEAAYTDTWSGMCKPDELRWKRVQAGLVAEYVSGSYYQITNLGPASALSFERPGANGLGSTESGFLTQAALFHFKFRGFVIDAEFAFVIIEGVDDVRPQLRITMGKNGFTVYDDFASTILESVEHGGGALEFMVFYGLGDIRLKWRKADTGAYEAYRLFNEIVLSMAQPESINSDLRVAFGQSANHTGAIGAWWLFDSMDVPDLDNSYISADVKPREIGEYYFPSWLMSGALVSPNPRCFPGDYWSVSVKARFSLDRALPLNEPRPLFGWRSQADGVESDIIIKVGEEPEPMGRIGAFFFKGFNAAGAQLSRRSVDGSEWELIGEIENTRALSYVRQGKLLTPIGSGDTSNFRLLNNELIGAQIIDDAGSRRAIEENKTGDWIDGISYPATITANMSAEDAASGDGFILYPDSMIVFDGSQPTQYYKIHIPAQATLEGFYQAKIMPGEIVPFTCAHDNGLVIQSKNNVEIREYRPGSRKRIKHGERRLIVEAGWVQSGIDESSKALKYWNSIAVGRRGDTPWTIQGIIEAVQEQIPVVLIADLPDSSGVTIFGKYLLVYGFASGDVSRLEQVLGKYGRRVFRIPAIRIEEEL